MAHTERIPAGIHNAIDYERLAPEVLDAQRFAYIAGGSGLDATPAANRSAFKHWAIVPRLLRDVRGGHSHVQLAGMDLPHPFLLAPVAHGLLAHPQAELATARAAKITGTCLVARMSRQTDSPSSPGIITSSTTRSIAPCSMMRFSAAPRLGRSGNRIAVW